MEFLLSDVTNVILVTILFFIICHQKNPGSLLWVLFIYGALHFSYSVVPLFSENYEEVLILYHAQGGSSTVKIIALVLLFIVYVILGKYSCEQILSRNKEDTVISLALLSGIFIILLGYILNARPDDIGQFKNFISIEAMLILLLVGYLSLKKEKFLADVDITSWLVTGLILLVVIDSVAFYEVFSHRSWANTYIDYGGKVYRASSTLFNPNLLGLFMVLVYLGCAYGMYAYKNHFKKMLIGMVLSSLAIYMSGSRSAGLVLLTALMFPAFFVKGKHRFFPLLVFPLTMVLFYAVISFIIFPFTDNIENWKGLMLLGERFAETPFYIINYILESTGASEFLFNVFGVSVTVDVPMQVELSIEGRFNGQGKDAGWLLMYDDIGWQGMIGVVGLFLAALYLSLYSYLITRDVIAVYAISILSVCFMSGWVLRFQLFPVWLFIAVVLTPCLAYWSRTLEHSKHGRSLKLSG
jgi:hypothetical protein